MTRLDQTAISNSVHLPSNITINCGHWTGGTAFSISRLSTFLNLWFQLQGGIGIKSTDVRFRLWPGKARIRTESSAPRVVSVSLTHGSRNHIWSTTTCFEFLGGQKQILLFCWTLCAWPRQKNLLCNDASLHHDHWHDCLSGDDGHRVLLHHHRHHRPWRHRPCCHPGKTLCCSQQKDTPGMSAKKGFTFVSRIDLYLRWVWWISLPYKQRQLALELLDGSP